MNILGLLAAIASLTITLVGLPTQIYKNRVARKNNLSLSLIISALCSYGLWALYGWTKLDYFLIIPQTTGFFLAIILLIQYLVYKKID